MCNINIINIRAAYMSIPISMNCGCTVGCHQALIEELLLQFL
jgi:hypothetical protein